MQPRRRLRQHQLDPQAESPTTENKVQVRELGNRCIDCRTNIRKVSRVIMVNQLWMWILDKKTILTAFPKRYRVNKQDYSGVHKAIRMRLKGLKGDHIKTVFDLALIILDKCSNAFFLDRTKTKVRPSCRSVSFLITCTLLMTINNSSRIGSRKSSTSFLKP